jgi:hypothetical protein
LEGRVLEDNERLARDQLGTQFQAEWDAGSALTLEEAITLAREDA